MPHCTPQSCGVTEKEISFEGFAWFHQPFASPGNHLQTHRYGGTKLQAVAGSRCIQKALKRLRKISAFEWDGEKLARHRLRACSWLGRWSQCFKWRHLRDPHRYCSRVHHSIIVFTTGSNSMTFTTVIADSGTRLAFDPTPLLR